MDGFSIRSSDAMLRTGRTTSELRNSEINKEVGATGDVQSFADTLKSAVNSVNELSHEANTQVQKLATGETKNIPEVMIASEKASVAFKLMLQVRNKIIDAYQEVMKMQV